jgi:hypothetical protein
LPLIPSLAATVYHDLTLAPYPLVIIAICGSAGAVITRSPMRQGLLIPKGAVDFVPPGVFAFNVVQWPLRQCRGTGHALLVHVVEADIFTKSMLLQRWAPVAVAVFGALQEWGLVVHALIMAVGVAVFIG